jgi:hypothetical protein
MKLNESSECLDEMLQLNMQRIGSHAVVASNKENRQP